MTLEQKFEQVKASIDNGQLQQAVTQFKRLKRNNRIALLLSLIQSLQPDQDNQRNYGILVVLTKNVY
jgi:hypothetical protein